MTKHIIGIRHGQALHNIIGYPEGVIYEDTSLTIKGMEQALNAQYLLQNTYDIVYCSPLLRTLQTASIIFPNTKIIALDCLMEYPQNTDLCNKRSDKWLLKKLFQNVNFSLISEDNGWNVEDADSHLQAQVHKVRKILKDTKHDNIAIVSHSSWLKFYINGVLKNIENSLPHCIPLPLNAPKFYDYQIVLNQRKFNEWVKLLPQVNEEIKNINEKIFISWPEKNLYNNDSWKIIPILYTIPSNNVNKSIWIEESRYFIPTIYDFVKSLSNVRTALISRMQPNTELGFHCGWADVSNHVLRSHLSIKINDNSGVIVQDEKKFHKEKGIILFDDSLNHSGFNMGKDERYVLLLDFVRPSSLPRGTSPIKQTAGLTNLVKSVKIIKNVYEHYKTNL